MTIITLDNLQLYDELLKQYLQNKYGKTITEYDSFSSFPETGEHEKLYIDKATQSMYYWDDSYKIIGNGQIDEQDIIDALGYVPTVVKIVRW